MNAAKYWDAFTAGFLQSIDTLKRSNRTLGGLAVLAYTIKAAIVLGLVGAVAKFVGTAGAVLLIVGVTAGLALLLVWASRHRKETDRRAGLISHAELEHEQTMRMLTENVNDGDLRRHLGAGPADRFALPRRAVDTRPCA